jgi:hypothetical protein
LSTCIEYLARKRVLIRPIPYSLKKGEPRVKSGSWAGSTPWASWNFDPEFVKPRNPWEKLA